jgi:hypothetical protein
VQTTKSKPVTGNEEYEYSGIKNVVDDIKLNGDDELLQTLPKD